MTCYFLIFGNIQHRQPLAPVANGIKELNALEAAHKDVFFKRSSHRSRHWRCDGNSQDDFDDEAFG